MNASKNLVRNVSAVVGRRQVGTCKVNNNTVDISKLKQKQTLFQAENDKPVYIKGGVTDVLLYRTTVGLVAVGMGLIGKLFYELAFK